MKHFFLLLVLLLSQNAFSSQLTLSFGPSVDGTIGDKKMTALAYEIRGAAPSLVFEAGGWNDQRMPTFFGGVNFGVHIESPTGIAARIGFGPAVISQTDDRLSSLFEFHIQARLGIEQKNWATGIQFDHFSNAGLFPPNLGRDIASLYIGVPL